MSLDDVTLAHVADTEHEGQLAVALADDGVPAEEQRLRALLGPRQLCEHHSHHEGLDHDARDALQTHHEDGGRAVLLGVAGPIPCLKTTTECSRLLLNKLSAFVKL